MRYLRNLSLLSILAIPFAAQAQVAYTNQSSPNGGNPLANPAWSVVTTGGGVNVTIEPFGFRGSPDFDDVLYAGVTGGPLTLVGHNHNPGSTIYLGSFAAGTEITVAMFTPQNDTYYTGSQAVLNPDGYNHTDLYDVAGGTIVDFEDLVGLPSKSASDWNYGDASVLVSNAQAVPEPLPCAALGLGVIGLLIRRKRA